MGSGTDRAALAALVERLVAVVPTNWCDSLLTGPKAVIGKPPYGCPDIERLLNALRERLRTEAVAKLAIVIAERDEARQAATELLEAVGVARDALRSGNRGGREA